MQIAIEGPERESVDSEEILDILIVELHKLIITSNIILCTIIETSMSPQHSGAFGQSNY